MMQTFGNHSYNWLDVTTLLEVDNLSKLAKKSATMPLQTQPW